MAEIKNGGELRAWLADKPVEFAIILAARAALRVVPVLGEALREDKIVRRESVVLAGFRALAAAFFAGTWPRRAAEIRQAVRAAREAIKKASEIASEARINLVEATEAVFEEHEYIWDLEADARALGIADRAISAAAHATQTIIDAVDSAAGIASSNAAFEATTSAVVAAHTAVDGVNGDTELLDAENDDKDEESPSADHIKEFWNAVEEDAKLLEEGVIQGGNPANLGADLSERALWPSGIPIWAGRRWADFKDELPEEEGWRVWIIWYEDRLLGQPAVEQLEFDQVTTSNENWDRGPRIVNAIFQEIREQDSKSIELNGKSTSMNQEVETRYYSPDDNLHYVTASNLGQLERREQIAYMIHWFHEMFEDPANETPYESREGGYQYIWGGPYDAREELFEEFSHIVPEEAIEDTISQVESDGIFYWAPSSRNPNHLANIDVATLEDNNSSQEISELDEIRQRLARGVTPKFGDPVEIKKRNDLQEKITDLRELLQKDTPVHGGIGHNRPPEPLTAMGSLESKVTQAVDEIDEELKKPAPDVETVANSTSKLEQVKAWIGRKIDKAVDGFAVTLGVNLAPDLSTSPIFEKITQILRSALDWLNATTVPF